MDLDWEGGQTIAVRIVLTSTLVEPTPNTPATGLPTISGTPQVGETLTAGTANIADADGLDSVSYNYQWMTDNANIQHATGSSHTLTGDDEGKAIKVKASFTDDAGNAETLTSQATTAVAPRPNRHAAGAPSIQGVLQDQQVLTADTVGIIDADGLADATFSYQWMRITDGDSSEVTGQTSSTYTLTTSDVGNSIQLKVAFTDDREHEESLTSAATPPVAASGATWELLWLSTMTPEDPDGLDTDFRFSSSADEGSLSPAAFTDGEDTRAITFLGASFDSDATLALELDFEPTTAQIATWRLALHDTELAFADAIITQTDSSPPSYRYQWDVTALAVDDSDLWDDEEAFTVSLLEAINLPATGVPTISGIPQVNETLSAAFTGITDGNGLDHVSYEYQWIAGGSDIDGATGSSFTLTSIQEGQTIQVQVNFEDDDGFSETATSIATDTVAAAEQANSPAEGLPTIGGTPQVDETLTADVSSIADEDGLTNVSYKYQWIRNDGNGDSDIPGATDTTYILDADDVGKTVQVRVTFTDDAENEETLTSEATEAVAAKPNSEATGAPTITGTPQVGVPLTADTSAIDDADGLDNVEFSYQWIVNDGTEDADINDATDSTYTPSVNGVGKTIKVKVSFTDDAGNEETLTSEATDAVAAKANTAPTGLPTITGTPQVDETLTADTAGISDDDGLTNVSYSYQWIRSDNGADTDIAGETDSTYTLVLADLGKTIKVRVTFTDDSDNQESLLSEATVAVAATVPSAPQSLTVTRGSQIQELDVSWQAPSSNGGAGVTGYRVQWKEATDGWDTAADVSEAPEAGTTHTITSLTGEVEYAVRVIATNDVGDSPASTEARATPADSSAAWTATLTVGVSGSGSETVWGYSWFLDGMGTLDNRTYNEGDQTIEVMAILLSNGFMAFNVRPHPGVDFVLTVDGTEFASADATEVKSRTLVSYVWATTLGWAEDDRVALSLTLKDTDSAEQPEPAENTPATGQPTINGTPQVDQTLTADTSSIADEDGLDDVSYSYQWIAGSTEIQNASDSTHTPSPSDVGKTIQVKVSFTDDAGNAESLTSQATSAVAPRPNRPATGAPSIQGVLQDQETLTADTVGIADVDGTDDATISYQWMRVADGDAADITGATGSTHTLTSTDVGDRVQLRVTFTDDRDNAESITSAVTEAVIASGATRDMIWLSIMTPEDPDGLDEEFNFDSVANQGSLSPATFTDGEDTRAITFLGASFGSDTTLALELGFEPATTQVATWRLEFHDTELAFADATVTQTGASPPSYRFQWDVTALAVDDTGLWDDGEAFTVSLLEAINLSAAGVPTIGGTPQVNETLTAAITGITDGNGLDNVAYRYQWTAGGSDIGGATGSSLTLTSSQEGQTIQVRVSFTDDDGFSETIASAATDTVAATPAQANNSATGAPSISGTPQVEQTLTADTSAIDDQDGLTNVSYEYQWMAAGTAISGATGSSYTLTANEQGDTIQVRVNFQDDSGNSESLTSVATDAVAAAETANNPATGLPTISGTPQVDRTLTADTSPIDDEDGLTNVSYRYQWIAGGTDIDGATGSTHTLTASEQGKTVQVKVTFTDDADNEETLTSIATAEVAAAPVPLTVRLKAAAPATHDGSSEFTFEIEFSEEFGISYATLRDHAFNVTGGSVERAQRTDKPSNIPWRITVKPQGTGDVTIELPATTDCGAAGAICTGDGRQLSNSLSFTVSGPGQ